MNWFQSKLNAIRNTSDTSENRCPLKFTKSASDTYDMLESVGHECFQRLLVTLGCLESRNMRYPGLTSRKWRRKTSYDPPTTVFESFIAQSEPDFYIVWHYQSSDQKAIVILLIDVP